jgi:hypothetical protein
MDPRRGGDQRIGQQVIRTPVHELGPGAEDTPVDRQHIPGLSHLVDPGLDLGGFLGSLLSVISTPAWSSRRVTAER